MQIPLDLEFESGAVEWGDLAAPAQLQEEEEEGITINPDTSIEEDALEFYTPPVLKDLGSLEEEFAVTVTRDWTAFGVLRYIVRWDQERLENWRDWRIDSPNGSSHHFHFALWEEFRLRHTLAAYDYKWTMAEASDESDDSDALFTLTVVEYLAPTQLLRRFPFVWDQDGDRFGIRIHRANLSEICRLEPFRGMDPMEVAHQAGLCLVNLALERADCEVEPSDSFFPHMVSLRFTGMEETARKESVRAIEVISRPSTPSAAPRRLRAIDVLKANSCIAWKRDGAYHAIELHRVGMSKFAALPGNAKKSAKNLVQEVREGLLEALKGCDDCEIQPPPRGSDFLFVVRMI